MPLDLLASKLVVPTRQQLHDKFLLWCLVRNPECDTRPGGLPDIDANVWSDVGSLLLSQAVTIAGGVSRATAKGSAVDLWAFLFGTQRGTPQGSGGAVAMVAASNGAQVVAGDILTHLPTQLKFRATVTGTYGNGQPVPIAGLSTGPQTNLPAGTILTWQINRPGNTNGTAAVIPQADGSGLSGGAGAEEDDDVLRRLQLLANNPPASGNDAAYQDAVSKINGVAVQQCFTICGVMGGGTIGVMFTLRPGTPGANRIPSPAQMASVLSVLAGGMPGDDGIYMCAIVAAPVTLVLKTIWQGASGWADSTTFPQYHSGPFPNTNLVAASPNAAGVISAVQFRLSSPVMTEVPQVGQSVGFLDLPNLLFRRKKILSVAAITSTQYDIVVDTGNGISDTTYTPFAGQACCPWSDSLQSLVTPVVRYFDVLGPGEQFASFFDPGRRQRRSPPSPQQWPNQITNRLLGGSVVPQPPQGPQQNQPPVPTLFTTTSLYDVELIEPAPPFVTPVGVPGVFSNLLTLGALVAFPE